jgi:putative oxidoreductase
MDWVFLIGRSLFAYLVIGSGVAHLTQTKAMAGYAGSKGVPSPELLTRLTGVQLLLGGLSVLLGVWGDLGSILLLLFLVPTAFLMHGFWKESEAMAKQMEMVQFNKDIALAGATLAFWWVFDSSVGLTITGPLFG